MLKQRVVTAVVLMGLFLGALYGLPAQLFSLVMALALLIGVWEWSCMAGIKSDWGRWVYTLLAALLMLVANKFVVAGSEQTIIRFLVSACLWWLIALAWVASYPKTVAMWGNFWTKSIMGWLVLIPAWVAIAVLVGSDSGASVLLFVVLIVIFMDTGGYVAGRKFGKNKLAPTVSPGKTWEGLLGGLTANVVLIIIFSLNVDMSLKEIGLSALIILITALFSVLGDLSESMIKRHSNMKDSGTILPGHGGVMDRVDGMTAAVPVFTLLYLLSH